MFGSDSRADGMARYFDVHPQDAQPHRIAQVMAMLRDNALSHSPPTGLQFRPGLPAGQPVVGRWPARRSSASWCR